MKEMGKLFPGRTNRRSFLKKGTVAAGAATLGAGVLPGKTFAFNWEDDGDRAPITGGGHRHSKVLAGPRTGRRRPLAAVCGTRRYPGQRIYRSHRWERGLYTGAATP